ncbi:hypothetical protein ACH4RA_13895 [Streptomyces smyrnaeus]|uniref:hypothetical protein n=1 Tax=Streptomyces TaxID=1883 RepID=UPI000C198392|nr:hypothetical protein [Streptomyces sp. RK75]MBQ0862983.1 hypothetical protein [Streptomyces sp. RK75]
MTARRTRRTLRSTGLVAFAAAAAFSLTACQDSDQDAAGSPQKKDSASASHSTGKDDAAPGGSSSESGKTPTSERNGAPVADSTESKAASPVRTQPLVDGSTAKIYRSGDQNYRAEIVNDGEHYGTLQTHDADDGANLNGMYLVLTVGGKVHSWTGGEQQGPGTFDLEGGWKSEVTKLGQNRYRAEILGHDGAVNGTLEANDGADGASANGVYIVLTPGGVISSHA